MKNIDLTQFLVFSKSGKRANWIATRANIKSHLKNSMTGSVTAGSIMAAISTEERWMKKLRKHVRAYGAEVIHAEGFPTKRVIQDSPLTIKRKLAN